MIPGKSSAVEDANEEISSLIEALHDTEQRLETLTSGEVDSVASRDGRTFLLRRAQDRMRQSDANRQAAILNALPAHIALLDAHGIIISVNDAWYRFTTVEALHAPGHAIGLNYLEICAGKQGAGSAKTLEVAEGIRAVLASRVKTFSIEYATQSPAGLRWFLFIVTSLTDEHRSGAVVMQVDVTEARRTQENLHASELRFRQMAESIRDVFFLREATSDRVLYVSPAYEEIWGRTSASLYAHPESWIEAIHPDDLGSTLEKYRRGATGEGFESDYRIIRPDGSLRWVHVRGFPVRDAAGVIVRIAGVAKDITEWKLAGQALHESERRFSDMLQRVELASVMLDLAGRITFSNDYLLRLTGWRREEVVGKNWFDMFMASDDGAAKAVFAALLANVPETWHRENEIRTRSGELRLMRWNNSVLRSAAGDVIGSASIGEDITEQRLAEVRIKRLNRVHAVLSRINSLIVRVRDRDELFRVACQIAVEEGQFRMAWIGLVDREAMTIAPVASAGMEPALLAIIEDRFAIGKAQALDGNSKTARVVRDKKAIVTNRIVGDTTMIFAEERIAHGIMSMATLPLLVAGEVAGVLALYGDEPGVFDEGEMKLLDDLAGDIAFAIEHIERGEKLSYLAYYDALTGLANRALFHERLEQAVINATEQHRKLALVLLDIERFKTINDTLGRKEGDALLKELARRLTFISGEAGRLARIDADHFAIMVTELRTDEELVHRIERRVAELFGSPFRIGAAELRVSAKFGIAMFPGDGSDADTLFRNAEAALKNAKASGERYLFYTQAMNARVAEKLALENELRQAIDREQFVLHYQPKVSLATGKVTGAEALIRWNHPLTGLVPPGQFIPVLEETGMIFEVGRWALRKAVEDHLRWRATGLAAVRIAVNVSPLQLRNRDFVSEIREAIGIDAHAAAGLELEITEGLIMENVRQNVASLQAIRAMGVRVAIDDFGTGFSSLSYLSKLPVDTLKIDRSFVIDMATGSAGLALVSAIINLAHALKLNVVAEGVETEEQARLLRVLNCDEMQGFLHSKPLPSDIFEARYLAPPQPG